MKTKLVGQGLLCLSHCVPFGFSVASFLFKNFFKLKCSWHTLVWIVQYSDSTFIYNMLATINIVNTYHCTNLLQYFVIMYYIYSLCCTLHPHDLFDNWKFVALYPLHLYSSIPSPPSPVATCNGLFLDQVCLTCENTVSCILMMCASYTSIFQ